MKYTNKIAQVSILGSSICNLSCSYCYLHNKNQAVQNFYANFNKKIQDAWIDGSYVNNIKEVFKKIKASGSNTHRLEIWGGEPLLLIKNLNYSADELFKFFNNLTFLMFPTNWGWNADNVIPYLVEFIKICDDNITERKGFTKKLDFHLQLSIDSISGILNECGHTVSLEVYKNNIKQFCKEMTKYELKNVIVKFDIHATGSGQMILSELNTEEKIKKYFDDFYEFQSFVRNEIDINNLTDYINFGYAACFPLCATPEYSTKEEGLKYLYINKLADYVWQKNYANINHMMEHPYNNFVHAINTSTIIAQNSQCTEANEAALMILPDGTLSECACSYVQHEQEYLDSLVKQGKWFDYRTALMRKKYFFNPLTATPEEEADNDWYHLQGLRDRYSTQINLSMAMCQELALSSQIDLKYRYNPELLLRHLCLNPMPYSCTREQLQDTRIPYLSSPGDHRRNLNGLIDYIQTDRANEAQLLIDFDKEWKTHYY